MSTVGLVPEMRQVAASGAAVLAVSLHATTDEVRDWIVPVNRRYNLQVWGGTSRVQVQRRQARAVKRPPPVHKRSMFCFLSSDMFRSSITASTLSWLSHRTLPLFTFFLSSRLACHCLPHAFTYRM